MTELTFEEIESEHTEAFLTLVRDHGDGNVEALDSKTLNRLRRDGHRFFILREGKGKRAVDVATAHVEPTADAAYVAIVVSASRRRRGYGAFVVSLLAIRVDQALVGAVEQDNVASKALAQAAGMRDIGADDDGLVLMRLE